MKKRIVVLGSTGSIGRQVLEVVRAMPGKFEILALCAGSDAGLLRQQALEFRPQWLGLADPEGAADLAGLGARVEAGPEAASLLAALPQGDMVVNGVSGFAGLAPLLAALQAGKTVALANKESIVCGHGLVERALAAGKGRIIPVDSEQSALYQCLGGEDPARVKRLLLTASGGPFRTYTRAQLARVTAADALRHPTWRMGRKITVDSASLFNKGLEINLVDERVEEGRPPVSVNYKFDGGLHDFCIYLNEGKAPLYPDPIGYRAEKDGILIEFAIQHTGEFTESLFSFVNNIPTPEGGFHETGFRTGLTKSLNDVARSLGILKEKDANLLGEDFREGLTAILSIKMKNVQFEGQTKTKLGNAEARQPVETATVEGIGALFSDPKKKSVFEEIVKKAQGAARVRIAARQAKEVARAKNSIDSLTLVGKLSACTGKKPELNELFIVEGDSAGGTAKQARVRQTQAILPLRGKPLNVEKKRIDQVLANEEIRTIISALGAGYGSDFDMDDLKYHKVIILSDADQDGMHIRCILLTFFFRYMRELINNGNVYIGMPPLYKVYKKDVVEYAYDDAELQKKIEIVGKGYQIQRYKGLGEMSAEQLWETTMDPARRNLIRVNIEDAAEAEQMVTALMGDRVEARKEFLARNANFNKVDTFIDRVNL